MVTVKFPPIVALPPFSVETFIRVVLSWVTTLNELFSNDNGCPSCIKRLSSSIPLTIPVVRLAVVIDGVVNVSAYMFAKVLVVDPSVYVLVADGSIEPIVTIFPFEASVVDCNVRFPDADADPDTNGTRTLLLTR